MSETVHEGGCLCGDIRYQVAGGPDIVVVCHCEWCQRRTGTAFAMIPKWEQANFTLTEGTLTTYRTITALSKGQTPGPEASIGKLVSASTAQARADFALDLQDMGGVAMGEDAAQQAAFQKLFLGIPGLRIAGGTDEILKNIIAERVLGMPGDIRVDKTTPFKDIPKGR